MRDLFLILRQKSEGIKSGDILQKILRNEEVGFNDYDVSFATDLVQFILAYRDEIAEYILEHGFSMLLNIKSLNEDVVKAGTSQNKILLILQKFLDKLEIDNELIILDPYFFAPTRISNYADLIEDILKAYLVRIDTLKIITSAQPNKIDSSLKNQIETKLKALKPSLQIHHTLTNNFHDRFWISNKREKGLITGTSINGLGFKFALIDRLNTSDVREIVSALDADGLL